jgi:hypothetical protein
VEATAGIVGQIRGRWPQVCIILRDFARRFWLSARR